MGSDYFDTTDWTLVDFEDGPKTDAVKAAPVSSCPKCGKELGRGGHFHIKACKADDSARNPR